MALCKRRTSGNLVANYHKIGNISLFGQELICCLDSYASEEARHNEIESFHEYYRFIITLAEEEAMGIRQLGYTKIKTLPDWADAEDC